MFGRHRAPFWFVLLLGIAQALLLRWLAEGHGAGVSSPTPAPPISLGFWMLFGLVVGWIWTGVQVAGRITLQVLAWSVQALWAFARAAANAGIEVGRAVVKLGKGAWDFFVLTYENVILPIAWKFAQLVEWAAKWGQRIFGPIFDFLDKIRGWVLRVYNDYVRPVLDIIDVTRRALRILASFGIEWARALDQKLAQLEAKIQLPFTFALTKINEIVGVLNRVVTLDGLLQRVTLIRSLVRDAQYAWLALLKPAAGPLTAEEQRLHTSKLELKTPEVHERELWEYVDQRSGPIATRVNEWVDDVTLRLQRPS
jgi:hypothetical protein